MRLLEHSATRVLLASVLLLLICSEANALITGGEGNSPLPDPGWVKGGAEVFNHPTRIAWWEGPPFGGGQWHSEHRGTAEQFNEVLAKFAKLETKTKRLVVLDGAGTSFWLAPRLSSDPSKVPPLLNLNVDWTFMVWVPQNFQRLAQLPAQLRAPAVDPEVKEPPAEITFYAGGSIDWKEVIVPKGIEVVDKRLEAHGFLLKDGQVLEGVLRDMATGKPLAGTIELQEVKPSDAGGYDYPSLKTVTTDDQGKWVVKNAPPTWFRVVGRAEGFAPRVATHLKVDDQPRWQEVNCTLAPHGNLEGQVVDSEGKPLEGVEVKVTSAMVGDLVYQLAMDHETKTGADGKFAFAGLPQGKVDMSALRDGYIHIGLIEAKVVPSSNVVITLAKSGGLEVVVEFPENTIYQEYLVEVEPEGGHVAGSYGGSGQVDENNMFVIKNLPPGKYKVHGHPNPTTEAQRTKIQKIEVKPGETAKVTVKVEKP
jgi:hypothetical protein